MISFENSDYTRHNKDIPEPCRTNMTRDDQIPAVDVPLYTHRYEELTSKIQQLTDDIEKIQSDFATQRAKLLNQKINIKQKRFMFELGEITAEDLQQSINNNKDIDRQLKELGNNTETFEAKTAVILHLKQLKDDEYDREKVAQIDLLKLKACELIKDLRKTLSSEDLILKFTELTAIEKSLKKHCGPNYKQPLHMINNSHELLSLVFLSLWDRQETIRRATANTIQSKRSTLNEQ